MMRKIIFISLLALLAPFSALAEQRISDYTIHIELRSDGVATVQEEILYDFGTEQRHGIIREIPLVARMPDGSEREILITNLAVSGTNGKEFPFDVSGGGNFVEIKIGDPNMMVRGEVLYVLRYDVIGAINSMPEANEFFWNAIGNDWDVPIERVRLQVALPRTLPETDVAFACYSGFAGSVTPCESGIAEGTTPGSITMLRFLASDLPPKAGMSLAVAVPTDVIVIREIPKVAARTMSVMAWIKEPAVGFSILLPVVVLLAMLYRWKLYGKNPIGRTTIVTEYEPPEGVDPMLAGFLLRERVRNEDVSALIIALAERGYLSIESVEKEGFLGIGESQEVILHRVPMMSVDELLPHEAVVLEALFPGSVMDATTGDIKTRFMASGGITGKIDTALNAEVVRRGFYDAAPSKTRGTYIIAGFGIFIVGLLTGNPAVTIALILTALIVGIVGWFMPKPTKEGAVLRDEVLGYKEYLTIAEKERIRFHTDDAVNQGAYEKMLPYAVVFGLGSAWLARFAEFYQGDQHPAWITVPRGGHLNAALASAQLSGAMHSLSQTISAASATRASGSGGTGKVGGGFGGGGGRSW